MIIMPRFLLLAAVLSTVGLSTTQAAPNPEFATETPAPQRPIILTGPDFSDSPALQIDEYFRDLLQYDIHGRENTYRVTLGQTSMEELAALPDVTYDEIRRYEGKISNLRLTGSGIEFIADDDGIRVIGINYENGDIPPIWETRYGIGRDLFTRADRQVELGTAGIEWTGSTEASFWSSARETYAVKEGDHTLVELSIFPSGNEVSMVRIELQRDGQDHYYRLARISEEGQTGGFLLKSFGRLSAENRERDISIEKTLQAAALTSWMLINRPLGILPGRVTLAEARTALARRSGWKPEWRSSAQVLLTPENGYDLEFGVEVPVAAVIFCGPEDSSPVEAFTFEFHFTRGEYFPDDITDTTLRLNTERLAMRIVNELKPLGYEFAERFGTGSETQSWEHVSRLRHVKISIGPSTRFQPNDTWSVCVRVQQPAPEQD